MRRSVAVRVGGGLITAALLGCAQVVGIQDISSNAAAGHCVDTLNGLRVDAGLMPVMRWTDEEQCADQVALAYASVHLLACGDGATATEEGAAFVLDVP